jgi:hypothetical protein
MRILFVPNRDPDGIGDMLYSGLHKIPSVALHEFPAKQTYHATSKSRFDRARPFWLVQTWGTENVIPDLDSVDFDSYDHIIVNSPWFDPEEVFPAVIKRAAKRMVFIDGHDDPFVRRAVDVSTHYFKREILGPVDLVKWSLSMRNVKKFYFLSKYAAIHGRFNSPHVFSSRRLYPINFSVVPHEFPNNIERDIDVSLLVTPYTRFRKRFSAVFESVAKRNDLKYVSAPGNLAPTDYIKTILRSKVIVSVPGSSYDIFRYWEVPFYGRCMMSLKLPITIPNNFIDGESAVFFRGTSDFETRLIGILRGDQYEEIAKNGNVHFNRYHTDVKRAEHVLSVLKESD